MQNRPYILSVIFHNESGVLDRVIGLFSGRGYQLESLTFGPVNDKVSRMTLMCMAAADDRAQIEQIMTQINKLVPVIRVRDLTEDADRQDVEVTIMRLDADVSVHDQASQVVRRFGVKGWVMGPAHMSFFCVNFSGMLLEELRQELERFGNVAIARSGLVSLGGPRTLHQVS